MFTLGREIDIHYPTNRLILILSLVTAALGWLITGNMLSGASIGGGTFLTWALGREVDPGHEYSAFAGVGISLLNLFYYESLQLLVIFWILLMMRVVSGMTGKALTFLDIFSVLGMTIYLSINNQNSIYLLPFILAMGIIMRFKEKKKLAFMAAGIALATFIVASLVMQYPLFNNLARLELSSIGVVAMALISFIFWIFLSKNQIKDDLGNIINKSEIRSSQMIYGFIILLMYLFSPIAINNLIIYLSVIIGAMVYGIGCKIISLFRR